MEQSRLLGNFSSLLQSNLRLVCALHPKPEPTSRPTVSTAPLGQRDMVLYLAPTSFLMSRPTLRQTSDISHGVGAYVVDAPGPHQRLAGPDNSLRRKEGQFLSRES